MILTQEQKSAIVSGNIQSNVVGIDAQNVNFITNLLTDKLYSNPIESFLREIVSNAYDSHIEANSDEPVLIKLDYAYTGTKKDEWKYEISIRDYGTGLSPERFNLIYRNIGSSTKRESNDYIGSLGLGRFSCLAASSQCKVSSYYNGIKDVYLMYKDEGTIHIDKLSSTPTTEHNGLEVSCIIDKDYRSNNAIVQGIKNLSFFTDIYVDNKTSLSLDSDFNKRIIKKHKHFAYCLYDCSNYIDSPSIDVSDYSRYYDYSILYGDVLYPIKFPDNIHPDYLPQRSLFLKFDIGELDITPSRESLQYTKRTIAAIERKVAAYNDELGQILADNFGEFKDLSQLLDLAIINRDEWGGIHFSFLLDELKDKKVFIKIDDVDALSGFIANKPLIINNHLIPSFTVETFVKGIFAINWFDADFKFKRRRDNRYKKLVHTNLGHLTNTLGKTFFVYTDKTFSPLLRFYVDKLSDGNMCIVTNEENEKAFTKDFTDRLFNYFARINFKHDTQDAQLLLENLKRWYENKRIVINKEGIPQNVLDAWKALHPPKEKSETKKVVNKDEIVFWGIRKHYDTAVRLETGLVETIKKTGTVVICEKGTDEKNMLKKIFWTFPDNTNFDTIFIKKDRIMFCEVSKKNIEACKAMGCITFMDFMNTETNVLFRKLAAVWVWAKLNNLDFIKVDQSLRNNFMGFILSDSNRVNYISSLRQYYINPLSYATEELKEILDSCVENGFVDWKFYCKLPSVTEINLINFQRCSFSTNKSIQSSILMQLMRQHIIPMDVKRFKTCKNEFNECFKSW